MFNVAQSLILGISIGGLLSSCIIFGILSRKSLMTRECPPNDYIERTVPMWRVNNILYHIEQQTRQLEKYIETKTTALDVHETNHVRNQLSFLQAKLHKLQREGGM